MNFTLSHTRLFKAVWQIAWGKHHGYIFLLPYFTSPVLEDVILFLLYSNIIDEFIIVISTIWFSFQMVFDHILDSKIDATECMHISVRTHNLAGLYSTTSHQLVGCDVETKVESVVIDAVGEWDEDQQVTRYSNIVYFT